MDKPIFKLPEGYSANSSNPLKRQVYETITEITANMNAVEDDGQVFNVYGFPVKLGESNGT